MKSLTKLTWAGFLILIIIAACSKNADKSNSPYGSYKVTGTILRRAYPFWPNINNDPPSYSTTRFDTTIQIASVRNDTVRMYGLGITHMDTQDGPNCMYSSYCGFFATKKNDSLIFVPVQDPGGHAYGGARIVNDSIYLTYYHNYRNILLTYSMAGRKQ